MIVPLVVPEGGAAFEGHFPGRPILPGVTQLAMVARILGSRPVRAIPFARLRRIVLPGDRLELDARESEGGRVRIELKKGALVVANGELQLGAPDPPGSAATAVASRKVYGTPPWDSLLPHREPMLFLTRLVGEAEDGLTCEARVPGGCALVLDGEAPAFAALEAAAQTAAAWEALRRAKEGGEAGPRVGYLVGVSDVELFSARIAADEPLLVSIRLDAWAPPLSHYRVEVSIDAMPILRGMIATWIQSAA